MKYRPEIDGLRAVAVIPVIFFHAGFSLFNGGFVGVDIFFVISGFLITTIIINDLNKNEFTIRKFYERRARRILPAIFVVILLVTPFTWFILLPRHMADFAQSLIGVITFSSNLLFWRESGYFDTSSDLKPMLHTWSLAVEEQFYIFFPLILLIFWKFKLKVISIILIIIFLFSFTIAELGLRYYPSAAFFFLPTRAWELLLGSFCALYLFRYQPSNNYLTNQALSIFGIILIVISIFYFDTSTPTPSAYTLMPTIGACLIILFAHGEGIVKTLLSSKIMVGIGLISYSLYLWHQPIFALTRHVSLNHPSKLTFLGLIILTFILAFLTWYFVEQPVRKRNKNNLKFYINLGIIFSFLVLVFGSLGHLTEGYRDFNFRDEFIYIDRAFNKLEDDQGLCYDREISNSCKFFFGTKKNHNKNIILIGDSVMDSLTPEGYKILKKKKINFEIITHNACYFFKDLELVQPSIGTVNECNNKRKNILEYLLDKPESEIIIGGRLPNYLTGQPFNNSIGGIESLSEGTAYLRPLGETNFRPSLSNQKIILDDIELGIENLKNYGHNITIIKPIPEHGWNVPESANKALSLNELNYPYNAYNNRSLQSSIFIDRLTEKLGIKSVDPSQLFCPKNKLKERVCLASIDNKLLFTDHVHLSNLGSRLLWNLILTELE
jgi:peptidoglycan/LPS O-acetylase OafA/YrhL